MKKNSIFLLFLSLIFFIEIAEGQSTRFVKADASGTGTSWTNASGDLQSMINASAAGDQIWVAGGIYYPNKTATPNNRNNTFPLKNGVKIYGSFAGGETTLTQRNKTLRAANPSILSGDLGVLNDNADNAYHVVTSVNCTNATVLDGFTIVGGNGSNVGGGIYNIGSSPFLTNLTISGNTGAYGGGIFNDRSSPVLTNVIIIGNTAISGGGGMYNQANSSPVLTNVTISGNIAQDGGGIYNNLNTSPILTNVTISGNKATYGGAITSPAPLTIRNSIIYGNSSGIDGTSGTITNSLVQGLSGTANGNMNGSTNPLFLNGLAPGLSKGGDYRVQPNSPVINQGDKSLYNSGLTPDLSTITTDLAGNNRFSGNDIDLGAYQILPLAPDVNGIIYVNTTGSGNFTGDSWANASNLIQRSINTNGVAQVWVAGGTYKPRNRADDMNDADANDRNNAFVLKKDVKVYGGFAGTETLLNKRNLALTANASILSGDLGITGNGDNAYHVVIGAGDVGSAVLDGFIIKEGGAAGTGSATVTINGQILYTGRGAGIYNSLSSPIVTNVLITENTATSAGAGVANENKAKPIFTNVTISGNAASGNGGGMFNGGSSPVLTNVVVSGNTSGRSGGGMYNGADYRSSSPSFPVLTNVTIAGNTAVDANSSGGMYNDDNSNNNSIMRNSIIYGNDGGIVNQDMSMVSFSLIQGYTVENAGNISGVKDPLFVNKLSSGLNNGGDYRLQSNASPAYNSGNNDFFKGNDVPDLSAITTDLDGEVRIQNGIIDLGAYEGAPFTPITPDPHGIVYVTVTGKGDFTGSSWHNATNDLQKAIDGTNVQQVWVAGGTYKPKYRADNMSDTNPNDRNNSFVLKENIKIYGGFSGINETLLIQRDSSRQTNNTILSGNLGTEVDNSDNAFHVVISSGDVGMAELNGFTITGGNADGERTSIAVAQLPVYRREGGGIYNVSSSPLLANLIISGNKSYAYGGGLYNRFSSPVLTNVIISENKSRDGGGMYNQSASPVLTNVNLIGNNAISGAGIYNESSTPILINVSIIGNNAGADGGGILNASSSPVLTNVIVTGNNADRGGGMFNSESSPVLTNLTFSGNNASSGGGIYNSESSPEIRNTIIYGNSTGINNSDVNSVPVINYSLVQDLTGGSMNNIYSLDPLFVNQLNPGLNTGGNYRLQSASPAINSGNKDYFNAGETPDLSAIKSDLDGNNRYRENIDLGAYEFGAYLLPVKIVNYTAQTEGSRSKLKWTAASESNNKNFIISRSEDGKNFKEIGKVAGAGNSTLEKDYVYYDENPLSGINFYRLEQIDYDGRKTDLGIRTVNFASVVNNFIKVYPNPVKTSVRIEFAANTYNQIELTDANGKVLQRLSFSSLDTEKKMNMSTLSSGIYFIQLVGNNKVESRKVVKE